MKITINFIGRQSGAIGIFYAIQDSYKVNSISEARSMLYEDYEHIKITNVKGCTIEEFNNATFIEVESRKTRRQTNPENGEYIKTRSDAERN